MSVTTYTDRVQLASDVQRLQKLIEEHSHLPKLFGKAEKETLVYQTMLSAAANFLRHAEPFAFRDERVFSSSDLIDNRSAYRALVDERFFEEEERFIEGRGAVTVIFPTRRLIQKLDEYFGIEEAGSTALDAAVRAQLAADELARKIALVVREELMPLLADKLYSHGMSTSLLAQVDYRFPGDDRGEQNDWFSFKRASQLYHRTMGYVREGRWGAMQLMDSIAAEHPDEPYSQAWVRAREACRVLGPDELAVP